MSLGLQLRVLMALGIVSAVLSEEGAFAGPQAESLPEYWMQQAQETLRRHVARGGASRRARSAVLAVGAGMSLGTLKAARAHAGQPRRAEAQLAFESFPVVGVYDVHCSDSQVADAACSAAAYLRGEAGRRGVLGVPGAPGGPEGLALWALLAGKDIGIVTTSSVTHPAVAAAYAVSPDASWADDGDIVRSVNGSSKYSDIARQLMEAPGNRFKVILGGGRKHFFPNDTSEGSRYDNRDLVAQWKLDKRQRGANYEYVTTKDQLANVTESTEYLLGLFQPEDFDYRLEAKDDQPSLVEMTKTALRLLSKNKKGFFLFILGGKIQDAHKLNKAVLAIDETLELSKTIHMVSDFTSPLDTLLVVTANHGSTMTYNGYPDRWEDAAGPVHNNIRSDNIPYLGISYGNGPGFLERNINGIRKDPTKEALYGSPNFAYPANFPLESGTPGGEDVALFASGPGSQLFGGARSMRDIAATTACILQVGPGCPKDNVSSGVANVGPFITVTAAVVLVFTRLI